MSSTVLSSVCHQESGSSFLTDGLWTKLQEIADNASCSVEESSSATEESDSIGSVRNSSPEAGSNQQLRRTSDTRLSSPEFLSPSKFIAKSSPSPIIENSNKLGRLSPMVTGNASAKLQRQILSSRYSAAANSSDWGYHSMGVRGPTGVRVTPSSTSSLESVQRSSPDFWDVRATKTPVRELRLAATISSKRSPAVSSTSSPKILKGKGKRNGVALFDRLPDSVILNILSFLNTNDLVRCSRISRRFYFLAWEPDLWSEITLTGETTDADFALKTVMRLLARNSVKHSPQSLTLSGCSRLTDRGLAIVARTCPQLVRLEIQNCVNITNGGLMDLVSKCQLIDHLDVSGCHMISTISVHQPPPSPAQRMMIGRAGPGGHHPLRRVLNLQYLDLTDCASLEDSGLKMVVENCPQLIYLFLRRCSGITDIGVKYVASYCLHLRELSVSDCIQITDFGMYEVAKLGPNLRYLSVAKCNQISDAGVKQIARLCYKLRYLNVRGCESVSDDAIEMLARSCSRLRSLDIGKCDVTDLGLKMLSEHCPNLKKLSVKSCDMVSDAGIQNVAYYCRGLQQLNIQDCPVTIEGYRTVKKFCKRCIIEHSHPGFF